MYVYEIYVVYHVVYGLDTYRTMEASTRGMGCKGGRADEGTMRGMCVRTNQMNLKVSRFYSRQPLPTHPIMPRITAKIVMEGQPL